MYINKEYRPHISIKLENGVYIFDSQSATGKTYLCNQLKRLKTYGEPVSAFTYNDILNNEKIEKAFGDYRVIMLDRYDQYRDIGHDLINEFRDKGIILIDCKVGFIPNVESEDCFIELTENNIEVIE